MRATASVIIAGGCHCNVIFFPSSYTRTSTTGNLEALNFCVLPQIVYILHGARMVIPIGYRLLYRISLSRTCPLVICNLEMRAGSEGLGCCGSGYICVVRSYLSVYLMFEFIIPR